jgi:tetratricopeptide (TPR) repeat protein
LQDRITAAEHRARYPWKATSALAELGRLYHANGFFHEAEQVYSGLLSLDGSNPRWPHALATILASYGQMDDALPLLRRVVQLAPDNWPAHIRLADALAKANQWDEAARLYTTVLSHEPNNAYALLGHARHELNAGEWLAAKNRLGLITATQPGFTAAWTLLTTIDDHLGDHAAAETDRANERRSGRFREMADAWLDPLVDDNYDVYRLTVAADTARLAGDHDTALRLFNRAVELDPDNQSALRLLGNQLSKMGQLDEARTHLKRAVSLAPKEPDNWHYLILVLNKIGDRDAAQRALADGLAHCPLASSLHLLRGQWLASIGQLDEALAEFQETRRLRPEESNAYVEVAKVHFRRNRLEDGIAELREALKVDPEQPIALILLGRYAVSTNDEAGAKAWIRRARLQNKITADDLANLVGEYQQKFGRNP